MGEYIVRRDGNKDLKFKGEVLADVSNQWVAGQNQTRWKEVSIYKTESGKYVVSVIHRTCWEGEADSFQAHVCETAEDVYRCLAVDDMGEELLSTLAKEALEEAAKKDKAFKAILYEEV